MKKVTYSVLFLLFLTNCSLTKQTQNHQQTFKGWWIYGEDQHIFKDEQTLDEYDIEFINEDSQELSELYLQTSEMEYFPLECNMYGYVKIRENNNKILVISSFEILHIIGCGE